MMKNGITALLFLFYANVLAGQIRLPAIVIETGGIAAQGTTVPFWLVTNQYGRYNVQNSSIYARAAMFKQNDTARTVDYFYGLDVTNSYYGSYVFDPSQAYAGIGISNFNMYVGIKNEHYGTQDSALSMGGFLYSANAHAMPRVTFRSNDFFYVPYTLNILEIKGGISHGWFGDSLQYVKNALLHDKYAYARIGGLWGLKIYAGLHHAAMWGGTSVNPNVGYLPSGMREFWKVFFVEEADEGVGPVGEQINKYGNHIASYHFGINYETEKMKADFYYQTMLEDKNGRVGVDWKNKPDGLWGVCVSNKNENAVLKKVVLEYMNSTHQSGDILQSGGDNYFNNYVYRSGWTYYGMIIGTPVFVSPMFFSPYDMAVKSNRTRAFHAGLAGQYRQLAFTSKITYTMNYGKRNYPSVEHKKQIFTYFGIDYTPLKMKNSMFTCALAFDYGTWPGNNAGVFFSYKRFIKL